ncbi:hypothetical protein ABB37_02916 [Leptomonas pyrrhocoris]|uniref:Uncharacterized protein n=1 Tax=Leptomonas pyrrhocoris TaxID=157538 RepID=A0A0M9G6G7_LEPPY|nr:hypothetical protein ABB37_02916 [Leptomonas pyrrhocoris]KPA83236.1 hypothetical protein ABB37_02916 [Leptomonas pyrrhocoris]|eukprot:XP_015661675.1 hypothetical protein ABB37_02916 [Leptomonas pyrrhocoris]
MRARVPSSRSAKLDRLLRIQSSLLSSSAAEVSPSRWVRSSLYPAQAAQLLSKPRFYQNRIAWVPSQFLSDTDPRGNFTEEVPPSKPHLCASPMSLCDTVAAQDDGVVPMLNASFLHETSLFALLLRHPLPSSPLSPLSRLSERFPVLVDTSAALHAHLPPVPAMHYGMQHGHWKVCVPDSDGASWFAAATSALNVQLSFSSDGIRNGTAYLLSDDRRRSKESADEVSRQALDCLASGDYLENLIWPTECSSDVRHGITADCVWIDAVTVKRYSLGYYSDAIWVPFHPNLTFASWNRIRCLRDSKRVSKSSPVDGECVERPTSPNSRCGWDSIESTKRLDCRGELFICPLEM